MKRKKISLKEMEGVLSRMELKKILGGSGGDGGGCTVRCDQNSTSGTNVPNCNTSTVTQQCGTDLSNAVCVCGG